MLKARVFATNRNWVISVLTENGEQFQDPFVIIRPGLSEQLIGRVQCYEFETPTKAMAYTCAEACLFRKNWGNQNAVFVVQVYNEKTSAWSNLRWDASKQSWKMEKYRGPTISQDDSGPSSVQPKDNGAVAP